MSNWKLREGRRAGIFVNFINFLMHFKKGQLFSTLISGLRPVRLSPLPPHIVPHSWLSVTSLVPLVFFFLQDAAHFVITVAMRTSLTAAVKQQLSGDKGTGLVGGGYGTRGQPGERKEEKGH